MLSEDSILDSIKIQLGLVDESIHAFDGDLVSKINSAIAVLTQLGVGPKEGFVITGSDETYEDFLGDKQTQISLVRSFIFDKVKITFDSTSMSSGLLSAYKDDIAELEWRLQMQTEIVDREEEEEK